MTCTWLIFFWAVTSTVSITCPNRAHSSHTYVSKWLFSRSYTSTLLHCFAKCSALFWCFDRILQSAPHSMTSRTMSEFPLLQACVGSKGAKITQPWSVSVPLSWEFSIEKGPPGLETGLEVDLLWSSCNCPSCFSAISLPIRLSSLPLSWA